MADFNNFHDNVKIYNLEPYVLIDGLTGTTRYTGVSISSGDTAKPIWRIKKEWVSGNAQFMGFPDGDQSYVFTWSDRASYTYK
jgi:hypothetical protein